MPPDLDTVFSKLSFLNGMMNSVSVCCKTFKNETCLKWENFYRPYRRNIYNYQCCGCKKKKTEVLRY